jgi:transposase
MGKTESWVVSDTFWEKVLPLIPARVTRSGERLYRRKPGGGRKPQDFRLVFSGIVFVLRTGIQWKALPKKEYGSPSSIHKYFRLWLDAGFFTALWRAGLAEYDEMEGIAWRWQSIDGSLIKAPLARESVGKNPTDRGKKWEQAASAGGRAWSPAVYRRDRSKSPRRDPG